MLRFVILWLATIILIIILVLTIQYYTDAAGHCMVDKCCQTKVDEAGMMSCLEMSTSTATTEYPSITLEETTSDQPVSCNCTECKIATLSLIDSTKIRYNITKWAIRLDPSRTMRRDPSRTIRLNPLPEKLLLPMNLLLAGPIV